ncbi:hypothetical protein PVK06_019871 [Gossypium arboreum]|uniref:Uncharacterized protein n=1 Tax=Gossypium arboreum TaxID=29729 RepID=A0ABR0PLD8_GOSAR|nr:hypothetical protein PVK06_019871 [Gossypium arboreum]
MNSYLLSAFIVGGGNHKAAGPKPSLGLVIKENVGLLLRTNLGTNGGNENESAHERLTSGLGFEQAQMLMDQGDQEVGRKKSAAPGNCSRSLAAKRMLRDTINAMVLPNRGSLKQAIKFRIIKGMTEKQNWWK